MPAKYLVVETEMLFGHFPSGDASHSWKPSPIGRADIFHRVEENAAARMANGYG